MKESHFLRKLAVFLREKAYHLPDVTIVLPSERSGKYLASAISEVYGKPVLAPEITTMDRWIRSEVPFGVIDRTRILLRLYEIYLQDAVQEEDCSFEAYMNWGIMLVSDFDEIDRYMIDPKSIFRNLKDIREIEQWSFGEEELTESQKRFLEFWERLPRYYEQLNKNLEEQDQVSAGKAFAYVANNIHILFGKNENRRFVFAGFNALSGAEKSIVRQLEIMGRADILIDADHYYYDNPGHEAGRFLRDLSKNLDGKKLDFIGDDLAQKEMQIRLIECAQKTGQAKAAASILSGLSKEELSNTLLLLADESLIESVIRNLPASIGKANITLGLPIRNTVVRTWVDLVFSIQENKRRFATQAIYFNDLQQFWNHPLLLAILSEDERAEIGREERRMIRQNRIFLKLDNVQVGENTKELLNLIACDWENDWQKGLGQFKLANQFIYSRLNEHFTFERAAIEGFNRALTGFLNLVSEGFPQMTMRSFRQLFHQHWANANIAYHGNPIDGLQIMGLLETRALDFSRIICLGLNEGNLPPTNPIQTLIPMDLRRAFGLPTPREKQGLFAHHFYRLLHHCDHLDACIYVADEVIGNNEASRYLLQLEMELAPVNRKVNWERSVYVLEESKSSFERAIPKTPEILSRIDILLAESASASMWKKYLSCPLDFYYRYVMEFGEEESVEEEVEQSTFGTFIHATLEELYAPFARLEKDGTEKASAPPPLRTEHVERMLKNYPVVLREQFLKHFNGDQEAFMKGKNRLSYEMAMELTARFLRSEIDFLSKQTEDVYIESLERSFEKSVELEVHGQKKVVKLRGIIDRVDRIGDKIRIIDYKSGKVQSADVEFRKKDVEIESIVESLADKKHLLQLIQYAWLYKETHGIYPESGIISFISGKNQPFILNPQSLTTEELVDDFPQYIAAIMEGLYNPEIPFTHTEQQFSYCQYCG